MEFCKTSPFYETQLATSKTEKSYQNTVSCNRGIREQSITAKVMIPNN